MAEPVNSSPLALVLEQAAVTAGFPLASIVDIDRVDLQEPITRYDTWLSKGYAGEMAYLTRGRDRRANPRLVFPQAESILCVAMPYSAKPIGTTDVQSGVRYARYLRGEDYHDKMPRLLNEAMACAKSELAKLEQSLEWKVCVDTSALLERTWAASAGIGWIGKNGMLIHPQWGSYLLLGFALTNIKANQGPRPIKNYCGTCERCIQGCPTGAIEALASINSTRCISYLTLEKRGPFELSEKDQSAMSNWVAGCDICQEVCPFNTKVVKAADSSPEDEPYPSSFLELAGETEENYRRRVKKTALNRVKPKDFARNLERAMLNRPMPVDKARQD